MSIPDINRITEVLLEAVKRYYQVEESKVIDAYFAGKGDIGKYYDYQSERETIETFIDELKTFMRWGWEE